MNLDRAPLVSTHIAPVPEDERWVGLVRMHHIVQDHTALEVVLAELGRLPHRPRRRPAGRRCRSATSSPRPVAVRTPGAQERYFAELLGDVTEGTAPFGAVDVRGPARAWCAPRFRSRPTLDARLREVSRRLGASAATVMHVAWARALAAMSGREDVVFGTVLFGRMNAGAALGAGPGSLHEHAAGARAYGRHWASWARCPRCAVSWRTAGARARPVRPGQAGQRHARGARRLFTVPVQLPAQHRSRRPERRGGDADRALGGPVPAASARCSPGRRTNYPLAVAVDDDGDAIGLAVDAVAPIDPAAVGVLVRTAAENLVSALELALDGGPQAPLSTVEVLDDAGRRRVVGTGTTRRWRSVPLLCRGCSRRRWGVLRVRLRWCSRVWRFRTRSLMGGRIVWRVCWCRVVWVRSRWSVSRWSVVSTWWSLCWRW
ncbi:hypothetical protein SAVIM40S_08288 [Streptomyces avidinii]